MPEALSAALEHLGRVAPRSDRLWPALRSLGPAFAACRPALERLAPPPPIADLWRRDLVQTRARNLVLLAELEGALAVLAGDGVDTALFKGASALDRLYSDPGTRPMDDADVLIRPEDRARAAAALGRLGFGLRPAEPGRFGPVDDALHGEWTFVKCVGQLEVEIDLHWHLVADARLRRLFPGAEDADVWPRALPARLGAAATRRLAPADAALATAVAQVLGHPWSHPLGYLDLWLEIGDMTAQDRLELHRRAGEAGLRSPLWWSLRFAERLFGGCCRGGLGAGPGVGVGQRSPAVSGSRPRTGQLWLAGTSFLLGRTRVGRSVPGGAGLRSGPSAGPASDVLASVGLSRGQPSGTPPPVPADVRAPDGQDWAVGLAPPALSQWLGETLVGDDWLGLAPFRREMAARDLFVLLLAGPRGVGRGLAGPTSAGRLPDPRGTARAALALARAARRALAS